MKLVRSPRFRRLGFGVARLPAVALSIATLYGAPPVAVNDSYTLTEDVAITIPAAAGVTANDTLNGAVVEMVVESYPAHGRLEPNPDGGFRFIPGQNRTDPVTFTYRLRTIIDAVPFTIDPTRSRLQVEAQATTDYGASTDRDDSRVSGTLRARLTPEGSPFVTARVTELDARLVDSLDLNLRFGCLFGLCLATVNVTTRATDPDWMTLSMVEPGPAAPVVAGIFSQTDNTFGLAGTADIEGTGLAADLIPSGPQTLDTTAVIDLTNTQVSSADGTITLRAPVLYTGRFYLDPEVTTANYIDLTARSQFTGSSGFLVATAPASANVPESSSLATVTLTITPVPDAPRAHLDIYHVRQGSTLSVPAAGPQSMDDLVSWGARWRWKYDGIDPAPTWKSWAFDDSGWAEGPGELGFGDEAAPDLRPEATVIRAPGGPSHRTAYFRHRFSVPDPTLLTGMGLSVVRDDGVVVYLNGKEVFRDNVGGEPVIAPSTAAESAVTGTGESIGIQTGVNPAFLLPGINVLTAEVHQAETNDPDLSFDIQLQGVFDTYGVLRNDLDVDAPHSALTVELITPPREGTLDLAPDGSFTYRPRPGFFGTDEFIYRALDDALASEPSNVLVHVLPDDEDADGLSDQWERQNGLNYQNAGDAGVDQDGDGADARSEFLAGTDPNEATSVLAVSAITQEPSLLEMTFSGLIPGRVYQLESSGSLVGWQPVGEPFSATAESESRSVPVPAGTAHYRLRCLTVWP